MNQISVTVWGLGHVSGQLTHSVAYLSLSRIPRFKDNRFSVEIWSIQLGRIVITLGAFSEIRSVFGSVL